MEQSSGTMCKHYFLSRSNTSTWKWNYFLKKLFERNKTCNYILFHSDEKTSFLTESFYFHLKDFLTSSAYRRYFKDLFHKSVWAFLGLISEARIILSRAITLVQSDYPYPELSASALKLISLQLPHFILECLIYTNENMWEPFVLAHIIFCSAQKNQGQFHYRHNNGCCACEPHGSPSLLYLQPHTHSSAAPAGKPALPVRLFWSLQQEISSKSNTQDPPAKERKGGNHHKVTLLLWPGCEIGSGYFLCSYEKWWAQNIRV